MSEPSIAARLAAHAVETTPAELTPEVTDTIGKVTLDWLGLVVGGEAIAGSTESVTAGMQALTGDTGSSNGAPGDGRATVLPTGERVAPDRAALLNGTYAHSLDFDDTHRSSSSHPAAPVIAAAMAAAEATNSSASELTTAIAVGYDVACRMGEAVNPDGHYGRGFHITATCGTFGATAAAGRLWGVSVEELTSAFGINGSQVAGSLQFLENGAWNKRLHPGLAASRAIEAVSLAASGFRGSEKPIEGTHGFFAGYTDDPIPSILDDIQTGDAVLETALKPYPCCRYMHAAIDALIELATTHDIDPATVTAVSVDLPAAGVTLTGDPIDRKQRPQNFVDCQFSMPFAAALALSGRDVGLAAFREAQSTLDSPSRKELMDTVSVTTTDRTRSRFPEVWAAGVTIETETDSYERFTEYARGEPENPLTWDETVAKFEELATAAAIDRETQQAAITVCQELSNSDRETVTESLYGICR